MATTTYSTMPRALALSGNELICLSQQSAEPTPWISYAVTLQQIAQYFNGNGYVYATMRQLMTAMAEQGTLVSVFDALPSDITNVYNIAWWHAGQLAINDPFITGFLQPTLGYSNTQMNALYDLALTFPA